MWIVTPTKYAQSKHVRYIHKYHVKKHTSILYNNMWVSIYYIASMWILKTIQKQTQHNEKRGLEE